MMELSSSEKSGGLVVARVSLEVGRNEILGLRRPLYCFVGRDGTGTQSMRSLGVVERGLARESEPEGETLYSSNMVEIPPAGF